MTRSTTDAHCPLCLSTETTLIEQIGGAALNEAWLRSFGIQAGIRAAQIAYRGCTVCGLQYFTPPEDGAASLYETLQKQDWYYLTDKPEYTLAQRHLPAEGAVLEVGSGKAAFARIVGPQRYLGLEFNDAAIARAKSDGITLVKQPVQDHAQAHAGRYAAVVSFQVLEHVADVAGFVAACVQALAPGGTLVLAVPDHDGLCGLAQNNILDMPPHHVSHWNEKALRHIARLHGLQVLAVEREAVTELHRAWAERAVVERRLRRSTGLSPRVLDTRLGARVVGRLAAHLARIAPPAVADVGGHTILAAYRKPAA